MIVIAFLVDPDNHILMLHRNDRDEREPVKGGIELGESPDQAIWRELYEETSLTPDDISHTDTLDPTLNTRPDFIATIAILYTTEKQPSIQINHDESGGVDHDDYRRISLNKIQDYLHGSRLKHTIQGLVNTIQNQ